MDGVVDPARIAHEGRRLADPDVVCLQEVSQGFGAGEDQVEALKRELPGYAVFFAAAVDVPGAGGARKRFGNLLASRLPVGRVLRHSLPWPAADVPSMPRVALEAVVQAPGGAVRVITTHLEYYSSAHRAAQIERLRELHCAGNKEEVQADGPFEPQPRPRGAIVCGDFNMPPEDPLRARLLEGFFVDAWEHAHPGVPHPHTFHVHDGERPYCCDYVFLSEALAPRLRSISVDGANRASDHQPVTIELR
jgi:endonuclease/exonuclease/phosphatase family metal-dependent hydrolase